MRFPWFPGALALALAGCMVPVAPNDPPRGDSEDQYLSTSYRSRVAPVVTRTSQALNIQIDVDWIDYNAGSAPAIEGSFGPVEADLVMSGGAETLARNGLRAGLAGRRFFGALSGGEGSAVLSRRPWQSLMVLGNSTGRFRVGHEQVPPIKLSHCDRRQEMKVLDVAQAVFHLEVTPQQIPSGELKLRILPVLVYYAAEGQQTISFPDLAVEAIVRDGESILVGNADTPVDTLGSVFLRSGASRPHVRSVLLLTPKMRSY